MIIRINKECIEQTVNIPLAVKPQYDNWTVWLLFIPLIRIKIRRIDREVKE